MSKKKINFMKLRRKAGLSQADVARKLDVHINTYSLWERGLGKPSKENVEKLKSILDIS